jgi:hypothetical protein
MLSLLLTLALAQPTTPSGSCGPGKLCRVKTLRSSLATADFIVGSTAGPGGTTLPGFKFDPGSSSLGICNANNATCISLNLGTGAITAANFASASYSSAAYFSSGTYSVPTSLPTPGALRGWTTDLTTGRMWKSNTSTWVEVGGGRHPVTEAVTYLIVSDRTAGANAAAWAVAPRAGGANVTFTTAGTLSNANGPGTEPWTNYATTAVSGNQAHHSSAAWFSPGNRMSSRVGPGDVITSIRLFHGMSGTRPLTAGSATPTAHAAVFRFDTSAGDTNWMACTGAGVALTCTSTGVPVVASSDLKATLEIDCREASALGIPTACTFWVDGIPRVRVTTNLPAALMGHTHSVETLTAASRDFRFGSIAVETR